MQLPLAGDPYRILQHLYFYFDSREDVEAAYGTLAGLLKPLADSSGETVLPDDVQNPSLERRCVFRQKEGNPIRYLFLHLGPEYVYSRLPPGYERTSRYQLTLLPAQTQRGLLF